MTTDWHSDDSEDAKRALIRQEWAEETPDYLWYELGEIRSVQSASLVDIFYVDTKPGFGDIEVHPSAVLGDTKGAVAVLRVRRADNMPMSIEVEGRKCMLYMVGHSSDKRSINFEKRWSAKVA